MATRDDKARFGFAESFLKSNKEVRDLVARAARQNYTLDRFEYELRSTSWYRKRTSASRNWEVLLRTQPREARERRQDARRAVRSMAQTLGVSLTNRQVNDMAERSIRGEWDGTELQYRVGRQWRDDSNDMGGAGQQAHQEIDELTRQYGVQMSARTRETWARQVAMGIASVDSFRDFVVDKAKGKYRAVAADLDRGLTVDQLFDPYREEAARTLGVNPETIDVLDPKFSNVFAYQPPGEQQARAMTLDEFSRTLRTDARYGFDETERAKTLATELSAAIQTEFGVRG